jgi:hypothetical protein
MLVGARSEPMRIRAETTSSIVLLRPPVPVAIDANTARASHDRVSALSRCRCATTRCPSRSRNVRLRFSSLVLCRLCVWSDCWVLKRGFVGAHGTDRTSKWPVPMCLVSVGQREPFNEPGKKKRAHGHVSFFIYPSYSTAHAFPFPCDEAKESTAHLQLPILTVPLNPLLYGIFNLGTTWRLLRLCAEASPWYKDM